MSPLTYILLASLSYLVTVNCYPRGIPVSACTSMFPEGHAVSVQTAPPPFILDVVGTSYVVGTPITVTLRNTTAQISGTDRSIGKSFEAFNEGLFVQARKAVGCGSENDVPQGTFAETDPLLTTMRCSNDNDALRHSNNSHKHESTFTWTATQDVGPIYFRATVVWHKDQIWTNVFSGIITGPTAPSGTPSRCESVQISPTPVSTQTSPTPVTTPSTPSIFIPSSVTSHHHISVVRLILVHTPILLYSLLFPVFVHKL